MTMSLRELFIVAVLAGSAMAVVPQPANAQARSRCENGACKGPIVGTKVHTSYNYNTVHRTNYVTRYRDVDRPHRVENVHRIVNVTRIQPVTRVNNVTRVHNHTANLYETSHSSRTAMLPAQTMTSGRTIRMGSIPSGRMQTSYRYNTVQRVSNVTHYHDVNRTQYVRHVDHIVNVTRVQPVVHTNVITRIHDRPVYVSRVVEEHRTEMLPARTINAGWTTRRHYSREKAHSA